MKANESVMETSYKEKYEQALAKAKEQYNYPCMRSCMGILEEIFPELADSEDEKIRKGIFKALSKKDARDVLISQDVEVSEALAWLKRQGESSICNIPSKEIILAIWDLGNEWKELTGGSISTEYDTQLDYIQKHWHESEYYLKEMQGEKPIKFNNSDMIDSNLNDYCCKQYDALHKENGGVLSFARLQHLAMDIYGWCNEYLQGEQEPKENKGNVGGISANWSDDDERMLDYVIGDILSADTLIGGKETASYKCDWLKSLKGRVQHQQEWSKEDEACVILLDSICESSEAEYYDHPDSIIRKEIVNARNWLKYLKGRVKPQWKPSDEQMEVLLKAVCYFGASWVSKDHLALESLYFDLKKLKEGKK